MKPGGQENKQSEKCIVLYECFLIKQVVYNEFESLCDLSGNSPEMSCLYLSKP